jgi:hypothetical protein|tara:strand:+ start:500 stop:1051 length:552 start_codon:yes stop_codon:yes gene_type:complete
MDKGLKFEMMGGGGSISCGDCSFSQKIVSFTHGGFESESGSFFPSCSSGFQCESCGTFTTRDQTVPFAESRFTRTLEGVPNEQRAHRIEIIQSWKRSLEIDMRNKPKDLWRAEWEQNLIDYTKELEAVSPEELQAIKEKREESKKDYAASLFCNCGGVLRTNKILFCPLCKNKNLKYDMTFIT